MSIKGPLTYAGFLITHIENASVFAHFICNRCPYVVLYPVLFLWDHSIQSKEHHDSNLCVFINSSLKFVYVGYCGVLDH